MQNLKILAAAILLLLAGCSKAPEPATFVASWNAAVARKDAGALWGLLDKSSQGRILASVQRSAAHAAADKEFKALFDALNPSAAAAATPEAMAVAAIAPQVGGALDPGVEVRADADGALLTWRGKTTRIHLEDGQWRAVVGAVGFAAPDGSPVAMTLAWPFAQPDGDDAAKPGKPLQAPVNRDSFGQDLGPVVSTSYLETKDGVRRAILEAPDTEQPALSTVRTEKDSKGGDIARMTDAELDDALGGNRLVPDALVGFHVHAELEGLTPAEVKAGYGQIARRIAALAKLPGAYPGQAARVMWYYENAIFTRGPDEGLYDVEFAVGVDGSLAATHWSYSRETRLKTKVAHPRLSFGPI